MTEWEILMEWVARMDEAMGTNLDRRRGDDG